jgi:hypothetical protein
VATLQPAISKVAAPINSKGTIRIVDATTLEGSLDTHMLNALKLEMNPFAEALTGLTVMPQHLSIASAS